jgi:hypothetical protein
MRINDQPWKIMKAAEARARKHYPDGTIIRVRIRDNWREDRCEVLGCFHGSDFRVRSLLTGKVHNFYPSIHRHEVEQP